MSISNDKFCWAVDLSWLVRKCKCSFSIPCDIFSVPCSTLRINTTWDGDRTRSYVLEGSLPDPVTRIRVQLVNGDLFEVITGAVNHSGFRLMEKLESPEESGAGYGSGNEARQARVPEAQGGVSSSSDESQKDSQ